MTQQALQRVSASTPNSDALIETLTRQRDNYAKIQSKATCHIANLPVEVLGLIFALGAARIPTDSDVEPPSAAIDIAFVMDVSHVCRHWRAVATDQAELWKSLKLGRGPLTLKTKEWARRAGGSIDEIIIALPHNASAVYPDSKISSLLRQTLSICPSSFRIQLGDHDWRGQVATIRGWIEEVWPDSVQRMTDLQVWSPGRSPATGTGYPTHLIPWCQGDALVHLSLAGAKLRWDDIDRRRPNMKTLKLRDCLVMEEAPSNILAKLSQSPYLETLVLGGQGIDVPRLISAPYTPVTFHHLRHLELRGPCWNVHALLPGMKLPALRVLRLDSILTRISEALVLLHGSLQGPEGAYIGGLTELSLRRYPFIPNNLIHALRLIGADLEVLKIEGTGMEMDGVVDALAGRQRIGAEVGGTSVLCPKVTEFSFAQNPRLSGLAIKGLVKARLTGESIDGPGLPRIKSLVLDQCDRIEPELLPWLREAIPRVSCVYGQVKRNEAKRLLG